tara:strand:- start:313 stop:1149 length:837 start_codon:yes stop_codon:yes gene_type:complete
MDLKEQIRVALGLDRIKLEWQAKSEDGTIFVSTADELAVGVDISVLTEDGTTIAVPAGTYKTAEGVTFRVEEEGIVAEVMETETEEVVEEELAEEADVEDWAGMEKRIQNLEDAVADLKKDKVGGDTESEEMEEETTDVVIEEVADAVVAKVDEAVQEIAAAIDDATPEEVTPELAEKAAEIAVEILQDKVADVVEDSAATTLSKKNKLSKYKKAAKGRKLSKLKSENIKLRKKLDSTPSTGRLDTNKFSSEKNRVSLSKSEIAKLTKKEKYFYNLYN